MDENAHRFKTLGDGRFEVEVGYEKVKIVKMFGPLIFQDICVYADPETCQWVIERAMDIHDVDSNYVRTDWVEVARVEGQLDGEFGGD